MMTKSIKFATLVCRVGILAHHLIIRTLFRWVTSYLLKNAFALCHNTLSLKIISTCSK